MLGLTVLPTSRIAQPGVRRALFVALFCACIGTTTASMGEPRGISENERFAVEMIADALDRGPVAIFERLSSSHPFRKLPDNKALEAIEVRTGPMAGSTWELTTTGHSNVRLQVVFHVELPSGVDDFVAFEFVNEGDGLRVSQLECGVERGAGPLHGGPLPDIDPETAKKHWPRGYWPAGAVLAAILIGFSIEPSSAPRKIVRLLFFASSLGFLILQLNVLTRDVSPSEAIAAVAPGAEDPADPLSTLLPYRRAMAIDLGVVPPADVLPSVAEQSRVWAANVALQNGDLGLAQKLAADSRLRLAYVIRARLTRGFRAQAASYEEAASAIGSSDYILDELLGQLRGGVASQVATTLVRQESRRATPYYLLALEKFGNARVREARQLFTTAWELEPLPRSTLVILDFSQPLLDDPGLASLVSLHEPDEPVVRNPRLAAKPITVPESARSIASGSLLQIQVGDATLAVPGGAEIAPAATEAVPASRFDEEEDRAGVAYAEGILNSGADFTSSPQAETRFRRAADALANHNRWNDLARLTDTLQSQSDSASLDLLLHRVDALIRTGEPDAALEILQSAPFDTALAEPGNLPLKYRVAEYLAKVDAFGEAIEIYEKHAFGGGQFSPFKVRARKLGLQWALNRSGPVHRTDHFQIYASREISLPLAERIGLLLETELVRLTKDLKVTGFEPTDVNVLAWEDFRYNVTGSDYILGIYDGRVTFPFATLGRLQPEVIAILTHELTHAVVAQASNDNAPRWFQEGIAQRYELAPRKENVFTLSQPDEVIPFPLIDLVLAYSDDPVRTSRGYSLALASIMFLEDRYGRDFPSRMIKAYATGANTDDVILSLTGKPVSEVDREFRAWAKKHRDAFVDDRPYPYDALYGLGVDPALKSKMRFTNRSGG